MNMDPVDRSPTYLEYFNDTPQNFLLQSGDTLTDEPFQVESIFTEIGTDWPQENFPVLLSGSLVSDENDAELANEPNDTEGTNEESCPNHETNTTEDTLTIYGNLDKNHVILSNELFVRVSEQNESDNVVTHVINGEPYSITYNPENIPGDVVEYVQVDNPPIRGRNSMESVTALNYSSYYEAVNAFKCSICNCLCETEQDMIHHIGTVHGGDIETEYTGKTNANVKMTSILKAKKEPKYTMFLCSDCGNAYSNVDDLKLHMVTQHNLVSKSKQKREESARKESPSPVNAKKKTGKSSRNFSTKLLKKQQQAMKKVKCSVKGCSYRFAKDDLRKRHEECHVNGHKKQFSCTVCKKNFSVWRICSMHLWRCHAIDLGLLTCPMCKTFKAMSPISVINHMAIHGDDKPFICQTCGKGFKQLNQLNNHSIIHKQPHELSDCYTTKKCEFCDRHFANPKSLKAHIKSVHHKFKPFICNICGHQAARKEMLQVHYRQHTGDKPYVCNFCPYKTADRNCLRRHNMRHFGSAKYLCPYCDYQSIQSSCYKKHLMKKHPGQEGIFSCKHCKYQTINFESYLPHVKSHEFENIISADNETTNAANGGARDVDNQDKPTENGMDDDETQNCFLNNEHSEEPLDTGGITIPAEFDLQLNKS